MRPKARQPRWAAKKTRCDIGEMILKAKMFVTAGAVLAAALSVKMILPQEAAAQQGAAAAPVDAEAIFKARCASCHEPAIDRAPTRESIATRPVADLVDILTNGVMSPMAEGLSRQQIAALAAHLGAQQEIAQAPRGRRGSGWNPTLTENMCTTPAPAISASGSVWPSFGIDDANRRFQENPGLSAGDVPNLKVKWAFSAPGGSYGQPTVMGDWLFLTTRGSGTYALDAHTGCIRWHNKDLSARTTPMIIHRPDLSPSGWITFIGDRSRIVHAVDAASGKELWASPPVETHRSAGITGSPILYGDQLFVPTTSGEEGAGTSPTYECCSFRGSLVSLNVVTHKIEWTAPMITEPLRPTRKNEQGTQLQGPAGAAIWSAPTVDAKRHLVYVATGDSYTDAPTTGADAIAAVDMRTGEVKWKTQVTEDDNFIVGCTTLNRSVNCPGPSGPDFDFGSSPILFHLPNGKDVVLSGQKSGIVYGMDPDTGKVLWRTQVGDGSSLGGVEWGMAADDKYLYVPNSDIILLMEKAHRAAGEQVLSDATPPAGRPGLYAIDPASGKLVWSAPAPESPCNFYGDRSSDRAVGCFNAQSAAATVIPGVVFSGTADGWFRAYDAKTGKVIWAFNSTAQRYDTVNGVTGQPGGSIDGMGATVANGMVYQMSGFNGASNTGGNGTNVLLAFSVGGR